jgi:secondary thiamine-phosphate synthase enzyme
VGFAGIFADETGVGVTGMGPVNVFSNLLKFRDRSPPGQKPTSNLPLSLPIPNPLRYNHLMKVHTDYLLFNTKERREYLRITDEVAHVVHDSGVQEGFVLVNAMHITSGVYVNDAETGLIHDIDDWLEKLAPSGLPYEHHHTGEDNADAHLKRMLVGQQVVMPITDGQLDLGPWEQIYYAEFDGQRKKRVVIKVMGAGIDEVE